jgi:predicted secreted protein
VKGVSWPLGIAAYVVIWWVVIFAVLPFGVRPAAEGDPGKAAGAPANPHLVAKALVTTAVAGAIWLLLYWAVTSDLMNFRGGT